MRVAHITCNSWPDDPPEVKVSDPNRLVVSVEEQLGTPDDEQGGMLVEDRVVENMTEALRLVESFHPDEIHLRGPSRHYQLVDEHAMPDDFIRVPQPLRFTVTAHGWEDTEWEVRYDKNQPGTYHYTWANCPQPGYGFSVSRMVAGAATPEERDRLRADDATAEHHEEQIREFLSQVGPGGVIEDDGEDDEQPQQP